MKTKLMKMTASCLAFASALGCVVAAMMLGTLGTAHAGNDVLASCDAHTLRGSYVFTAHGWNIVGGVAQPKAIVEGIDFNADGTLVSPYATVSINGTIIRSSNTQGSYTLSADCTGTVSFTGGASFDMSVDKKGDQLWMIQAGGALPAVFEGTATRVAH